MGGVKWMLCVGAVSGCCVWVDEWVELSGCCVWVQ